MLTMFLLFILILISIYKSLNEHCNAIEEENRGPSLCLFPCPLIESLIEREIRNNMAGEGKSSIRIYPEFRPCESPTTDRVLGDKTMKKFLPKLTQRQEELLRLAGISPEAYRHDWNAVPGS